MFPDDHSYDEDDVDPGSIEEAIHPPEDLKLTVEVGLSQYQPNGLLELIARALLQQIGGRDQWSRRLEKHLTDLASERAQQLVNETIERTFVSELGSINWQESVEQAARDFMNEKVDSDGKELKDSYSRRGAQARKEWMVTKIVKESMDQAFKAAEQEWKDSTKIAIKETLTEALVARIAKALPTPTELRG